jgi:hypothetical protein
LRCILDGDEFGSCGGQPPGIQWQIVEVAVAASRLKSALMWTGCVFEQE